MSGFRCMVATFCLIERRMLNAPRKFALIVLPEQHLRK